MFSSPQSQKWSARHTAVNIRLGEFGLGLDSWLSGLQNPRNRCLNE
jgi:hypothetical protein